MLPDDDRANERFVDHLFAEAPLQDLRPEAAARIEAACLTQLRRRKYSARWPVRLLGVFASVLASSLGGSYLLWTISRALVFYDLHFR